MKIEGRLAGFWLRYTDYGLGADDRIFFFFLLIVRFGSIGGSHLPLTSGDQFAIMVDFEKNNVHFVARKR